MDSMNYHELITVDGDSSILLKEVDEDCKIITNDQNVLVSIKAYDSDDVNSETEIAACKIEDVDIKEENTALKIEDIDIKEENTALKIEDIDIKEEITSFNIEDIYVKEEEREEQNCSNTCKRKFISEDFLESFKLEEGEEIHPRNKITKISVKHDWQGHDSQEEEQNEDCVKDDYQDNDKRNGDGRDDDDEEMNIRDSKIEDQNVSVELNWEADDNEAACFEGGEYNDDKNVDSVCQEEGNIMDRDQDDENIKDSDFEYFKSEDQQGSNECTKNVDTVSERSINHDCCI